MEKREVPYIKRKKYLVAKQFQLKYAGLFLLFMFLTGALCSYTIYYTVMVLMGEKLASVYPQGRLVAIINTVNLRILLSLIVVAPFVAMFSIFLSHKIAGPMYRMEKFLTGMAEGDFSSRITLRKGDELMSLANKINGVIDSLRSNIIKQKDSIRSIASELDAIKKAMTGTKHDREVIVQDIEKLAGNIDNLSGELNKYKI
ncbi:MAG: methyl-accepting chemotaxis protein [Candidatus Omnitrophica bacterium]|nr:methyl-accepting chemotaxis protein [Candidatus Omnitrophota bacterium]